MKTIKSVTVLPNLIHQTKLTDDSLNTPMSKNLQNLMTSSVFNLKTIKTDTGLSNLIHQTKLTDDSLNTSMLKNF